MRNPLRPRTSGEPESSNGASSFHLSWQIPAVPELVAASVTLEIVGRPVVDRLYFWALQVSFRDRGGRRSGGGHLGLQHHPAYPGAAAVNWGGYDASGRVLDGSVSALPGTLGNANTRDFAWQSLRPYRLRVSHGSAVGMWAGDVVDGETGSVTRVRELHGGGEYIDSVLMWSEVFARCDHPSTAVRWSAPTVETASGEVIAVGRFRTSYQARSDGGCDNTDSVVVGGAVEQRTATPRTNRSGTELVLG